MSDEKGTASEADCPPPDAEAAEGGVYRCCKSDPPQGSDMQSAEEAGRLLNADPCLRRALSVFRSQKDAEHQVRLFRRWKRKFVAKATLEACHGWTLPTSGQQPSHTSWWPPPELEPKHRAELFSVVCEVGA